MLKKLLIASSMFIIGSATTSWFLSNYHLQDGEIKPIPVAILSDGGVYAGDLQNGLMHGEGAIEWTNGARYEGEFKNGLFHGTGIWTNFNGESYEGEYTKGLPNGHGLLNMVGGHSYEGNFVDGVMQGFGRFTYENGNVYEGDFEQNRFQGLGHFKTEYEEYKGNFEKDQYKGKGTLTYSNGATYTGDFLNNQFHGKGIYRAPDKSEYSGDFVKGKFSGSGSYTGANNEKYTGEFIDWRYQGNGTLILENGTKLFGKFKDGQLHGKGERLHESGKHYKGSFEHGQFHGEGEYTDEKGNKYLGEFQYGDFHGEGEYTYAEPVDDIKSFKGKWHYGRVTYNDQLPHIKSPGERNETLIYNQEKLLNGQFEQLKEGDPDKTEIYLLSVAGDGSQEVFRREINFVRDHFHSEYAIKPDHQVSLVNSRHTVDSLPIASRTSIKRGLQAIENKMNANDDILFLFMTSHGSADFKLYLNQERMNLADLPAEELAGYLSESRIKWKVIVVSACYSGGFIDKLKDDNTLIITSASHDKTSFGCSDENTFTYFGRAFFKESLDNNFDLEAAFTSAKALISEWEGEQQVEDSNPQLYKGKHIIAKLKQWQQSQNFDQIATSD